MFWNFYGTMICTGSGFIACFAYPNEGTYLICFALAGVCIAMPKSKGVEKV